MNYSAENTILIVSKKKPIIKAINAIAVQNNLKIFICKSPEDIIAVPCFVVVVDDNVIKQKKEIEALKFVAKSANLNEWQIWYFGLNKIELPAQLKKNTLLITKDKELQSLINKRISLHNNSYKFSTITNRVARIIDIYINITEKRALKEDFLCSHYKIHPRTLKRDIKVLNDLNQHIVYDGQNKQYWKS